MITAIVQARMDSARLPGKVLRPLAGRPALSYLLERLERCALLGEVVVATSAERPDDAIAAFCTQAGVACHRGPRDNVATRFMEVVEQRGLPAFVRVSGDSPLLDQALVDTAVSLFQTETPDLVTNVFPRGYPSGQSVEVVATPAFRRGFATMQSSEDLEHVTSFFYRHPGEYDIRNFGPESGYGDVSLALDTEADAERLEAVLARMERPHTEYPVDEVARLWRELA